MAEKKNYYPDWFIFPLSTYGGVMGWLVVHPMDLLKVRMQLQHTTLLGAFKQTTKEKGLLGLYQGLSAGIARQLVYATARLGLFEVFRDALAGKDKPTFTHRAVAGTVAGGCAALLSCPVEVTLVRMQADGRLPPEQRRNYKNVVDGLLRIAKEDGPFGYWRGANPAIVRAMAVGLTQVGFYDQTKNMLQDSKLIESPTWLYVWASAITGLVYSALTMPIETAKTRMQDQKALPDGSLKYKSLTGVLVTVAKEEGVLRLWKGYTPYFGRCAGHTVGCFLAIEKAKDFLNSVYGPKTS